MAYEKSMGSENLLDTGARITRTYIDDKVSDLAIEIVLVGVPIGAFVVVRVRVDNGDTSEAGRCFDCGNCNRIADKLGVIILNQWLADEIGSRWKVNESWGHGTGVAALTAAVAITDGGIDCCGVIGVTVTSCAIVLDIAKYFVR